MDLNSHGSQHQGHVGVVGWWGQALGFAPEAPASLWGGSDPSPAPAQCSPCRDQALSWLSFPSPGCQEHHEQVCPILGILTMGGGVGSRRGLKGTPGQWGIIPLPGH